jgi:hypothetical protein
VKSQRLLILGFALLLLSLGDFSSGQDLPGLPPLAPADLAMVDSPASPGAQAMILYMGVDTDNTKSTETYSFRIKVFTEEGRKYGNVEIPYYEKETRVEEIRARIIDKDGKVQESNEPALDREIIKAGKFRVSVKVLAIPDVQPGTIIEYSYRFHFKDSVPGWFKNSEKQAALDSYVYPAAIWTVQRYLFLLHGHFVLHPLKGAQIRQHEIPLGSPAKPGTTNSGSTFPSVEAAAFPTQKQADGSIVLDVDNIPAYEEEEYTLPETALKARVGLYYALGYLNADKFWGDVGRRRAEGYENFMDRPKAMQKEIARLLASGDTDEMKLRRIYQRVQLIKPADREGTKSGKELKQENFKENNNVEDVLERGYAFGHQINLLFVALVRAAGFTAYPILLTSRTTGEFLKEFPDVSQLNAMVVMVQVKGASPRYFDPEAPFCPFELLPWGETGAQGLLVSRLGSHVGGVPYAKAEDALVHIDADLKLSPEGALSGMARVEFKGQEALIRREAALTEDEVKRREDLEKYMKDKLQSDAGVKLVSAEGWDTTEGSLKVEYAIEIPNAATPTGHRIILPVAVFHANGKNPFLSARRVHNIEFGFPYQTEENVNLTFPSKFPPEGLPAPLVNDQKAVYYEISAQKNDKGVLIRRSLKVQASRFPQKEYPNLCFFYERAPRGFAADRAPPGGERPQSIVVHPTAL